MVTAAPRSKTARLAPHALLAAFPGLSAEEFAAFKADVKLRGVLVPVWTWRGWLVDGRERIRAAAELGVECPSQEWGGTAEELPAFVVSLNLFRRHLSESQRAMVAARFATLPKGRPAVNPQICGIAQPAQLSRPAAAKLLNVSARSVDSAKEVIDRGVPELVRAVELDQIAVSAAAALAQLPRDRQEAAVREISAAAAERPRESRAPRQRDDPDKYIRSVKGGKFQARPYDLGERFDLGLFATKHAARGAILAFWKGELDGLARFVKCVHTKRGERYRGVVTVVVGEFATRAEAAAAVERWVRAALTPEGAAQLLRRTESRRAAA